MCRRPRRGPLARMPGRLDVGEGGATHALADRPHRLGVLLRLYGAAVGHRLRDGREPVAGQPLGVQAPAHGGERGHAFSVCRLGRCPMTPVLV